MTGQPVRYFVIRAIARSWITTTGIAALAGRAIRASLQDATRTHRSINAPAFYPHESVRSP